MSSPSSRWRHVSLWCDDWQAAEKIAATQLAPVLTTAQDVKIIASWWFIRKGPSWRIRLLPAPGQDGQADSLIEETMDDLAGRGAIRRWAKMTYEPEIHAFGGADAMHAAHELFHADSVHLMDHVRRSRHDQRRELGLLLGSSFLRAADQDFYEQGDVWARVAAHRLTSPPPLPDLPTRAVRQLLSARTHSPHSPLTAAPDWPAAFEHAGQHLAELAQQGVLTRGLRSVLAHHILFAWNRAGIPGNQQGILAAAAAQVVFHTEHPHTADLIRSLSAPGPTTLSVVTTDITETAGSDPQQLRAALAAHIRSRGTFQTPQVEAAFLAVPRHLFLPGVDLQAAYAPKVTVTKRAEDGTVLSSASSPNLVASMLEQLDAQPGHRVLEIGAATGINAALLAELTSPSGEVVTIEIDDDLTAGARAGMAAAGYDQVEVICGDGALGHPARAPYDRIIVTADAQDISAAWWQQLAEAGRLVVPLALHGSGLTRCIPFTRHKTGRMVGDSALVCGFVPMRGSDAAKARRSLQLADDVVLNLDAADPVDETALQQALTHPGREHWTAIVISDDEPVEHLDLWLVTTGSPFARLAVGSNARERGLADPARRWAGATRYDGATIAYLTLRPRSSDTDELGVIAHGPDSAKLIAETTDLLQQWRREQPLQPTITAQPASTPDHQRPHGHHIDRPQTRLTIAW